MRRQIRADTHTQTSTITLAAHASRGLINEDTNMDGIAMKIFSLAIMHLLAWLVITALCLLAWLVITALCLL